MYMYVLVFLHCIFVMPTVTVHPQRIYPAGKLHAAVESSECQGRLAQCRDVTAHRKHSSAYRRPAVGLLPQPATVVQVGNEVSN